MDVALELRRRIALAGRRLECARGGYRLTALPLADAPGGGAFAVCEARPRGWWPILAGRVEASGRVVLTLVERPATPATVTLFLEFLLAGPPASPEPVAAPPPADWWAPPPDATTGGWAD